MSLYRQLIKVKDYYECNFIRIDVVLSIVITSILLFATPLISYINFTDFKDFNSSIISFFGTILGFLITCVTIIYALSSEPKTNALKRLSETGIYPQLYKVYFHTIAVTAILVALGFICIIFKFPQGWRVASCNMIFSIELLMLTLFLFRIYRCLWILGRLVQLAHQKD